MKKYYIIIMTAVSALLFASCGGGDTYCVKGTITETDMTNGAVVVLSDFYTNEVDTAQIVGGTFTFTGVAEPTTIKKVALVTPDKARNSNYCVFIPEGGDIEINLDSTNMVSAGRANKALHGFYADDDALIDEYYEKMDEFEATLEGDELESAVSEYVKLFDANRDALMDRYFLANKDNGLALLILLNDQRMYSFTDVDEFDAYVAGSFVAENEKVAKFRNSLIALAETAEGKMFVDFKGEDPDGGVRSLSDFVGKGQYVLVDFWASWCGPCRGEIPNIINIYDKYTEKGLVVLGVPVWDKRPDTDAAIEELGIKYNQIYVGDDRTPTNLYGISGIPQIMLFAPDGTIYKRDLRGAAIEETIKSVL